jgi:hypothetical protein
MTILHKECLPTELALSVNQTVIAATFKDCAGVAHVPAANIPTCTEMNTALALKANLVGGKVPASELPSYVDDVLEFATLAAFPGAGETGKLYTDLATNKVYRWSGSTYVEVSASALVEVLDEGSSLTAAATSVNFVGAGVTATVAGSAVTVTVIKPTAISHSWAAAGDGSGTITLTFSDGSTLTTAMAAMPSPC